jgi:hypothetical protein
VSLARPGQERSAEPLDVGFTGADRQGVEVPFALARGLYRITAVTSADSPATAAGNEGEGQGKPAAGGETAERPLWELPLAVNGQAEESNLVSLTRDSFYERVGGDNFAWVGANEEISLAGTQIKGQNTWWYLAGLVLALLLFELGILSWPSLSALLTGSRAPQAGSGLPASAPPGEVEQVQRGAAA